MFLGTHPQIVDAWKDTHSNAESCASLHFINWPELKKCIDGPEGEKLIEANWKKTDALVPKHTSVPWIVVNDHYTKEVQKMAEFSLMEFLCKNYLKDVFECL